MVTTYIPTNPAAKARLAAMGNLAFNNKPAMRMPRVVRQVKQWPQTQVYPTAVS